MSNGYIKLHRKMLENPVVCKDSDHVFVWIYLLLNATHTEHRTMLNGSPVLLMPGQLVTGRKKIAAATGVQETKVQRIMKLFKSDHQIEQQTTSGGSLVTLVSWDKHQVGEQQNDQQMINERSTDDQRVITKQEGKEGKKEKKPKKEKPASVCPLKVEIPESINTPDFQEAWGEWIAHRKEIKKPVTATQAKKQLRKLAEWGEMGAIASIEASIAGGWQGLFEQKSKDPEPASWEDDIPWQTPEESDKLNDEFNAWAKTQEGNGENGPR